MIDHRWYTAGVGTGFFGRNHLARLNPIRREGPEIVTPECSYPGSRVAPDQGWDRDRLSWIPAFAGMTFCLSLNQRQGPEIVTPECSYPGSRVARGLGSERLSWIPAFAGTTFCLSPNQRQGPEIVTPERSYPGSRVARGLGSERVSWIPAFAGTTGWHSACVRRTSFGKNL